MKHTFALILLLLTGACAHRPHVPPTFGFGARQCEEVRTVMCAADKDMPAEWCSERVGAAVEQINKAVGRDILRYGGAFQADAESVKAEFLRGTILVWVAPLSPGVLGVTSYQFDSAKGSADCIATPIIRLSPLLFSTYADVSHLVVLHELVHGIGSLHSEAGIYKSVMAPSVSMEHSSPHLTPYDIAALRAMYGV